MPELEIWKDVVGYEDEYSVSNLGRVIRKPYTRENRIYGKGVFKNQGGLVKSSKNLYGYPTLTLCKNGIRKREVVHRMVAKAFLPNPKNKPTVNHKNGVPDDNRVENLEWATLSEQMIHSYRVLGRKPPKPMIGRKGEKSPSSKRIMKLNPYTLEVLESFDSATIAAESIKKSRSLIPMCAKNGKNAGGFKWMYEKDLNNELVLELFRKRIGVHKKPNKINRK